MGSLMKFCNWSTCRAIDAPRSGTARLIRKVSTRRSSPFSPSRIHEPSSRTFSFFRSPLLRLFARRDFRELVQPDNTLYIGTIVGQRARSFANKSVGDSILTGGVSYSIYICYMHIYMYHIYIYILLYYTYIYIAYIYVSYSIYICFMIHRPRVYTYIQCTQGKSWTARRRL